MPYTYKDVQKIKSRYGYTTHEAHIFIRAFNAALHKYGDEKTAFKIAHAAVNKYQRHRGGKKKAFTVSEWESVPSEAESRLGKEEAAFLNNIFGWVIESPQVVSFVEDEEEEGVPVAAEITASADDAALLSDVMDDTAEAIEGVEVPESYLGRFSSPDAPVGVEMHEIVAFGDSRVVALAADVPGLPPVYAIAGEKQVVNALVNAYKRRGFAAFPVYVEEM